MMKKCDFEIVLIVEGSAEQAIIDRLMEDDLTFFNKADLIDGKPHRRMSKKQFENKFLKRSYLNNRLVVIRVIDSRSEIFNVGKGFDHKINKIYTTLTRPEIEALIIVAEDEWQEFKKPKYKNDAAGFCKSQLRHKEVKKYNFVEAYFADSKKLVHSINLHTRMIKIEKGEQTLSLLLKKEYCCFDKLPN